VKAAGNYVELRSAGRTIVQRASISSIERKLEPHGFVRIHRSMLVRRDRIATVRPQDVVLLDGTHLKLGKRYRAHLDS
jgi:DNA-binding LytR/AlgR family response regulator